MERSRIYEPIRTLVTQITFINCFDWVFSFFGVKICCFSLSSILINLKKPSTMTPLQNIHKKELVIELICMYVLFLCKSFNPFIIVARDSAEVTAHCGAGAAP